MSKPEQIIPDYPLKRKQDQFVTDHYEELSKCIATNLKNYRGNKDDAQADVWSELIKFIYRKAFLDAGWQGEIDCLRQSKTKIRFLVVNAKEDYKDRTENQLSYDKIEEGIADNISPPKGWYEATTYQGKSEEQKLMDKQLNEAIFSFARDEYEIALIEAIMGLRSKGGVATEFGKSPNTITNNIKEIGERMRKNLIIGDYI